MYWSPHDSYPCDEAFGPGPVHHDDRLRHLVFLDGRLVDTWSEAVEGTRYQGIAADIDSERRRARYTPEPIPPPHERVLTWLDDVVGGRRALLALDEEPLSASADSAADSQVVDSLRRVADELFDSEFLHAALAMLAAVRRGDVDLLAETPAAEVAAAICWLVGRANGLVGQGTPVTQKMLKRVLWLNVSPSRRTPRIKSCLRGLWPTPGVRPAGCPDLLELGDAAFLTSATRRRLITLRDRSLLVAEELEADRRAREALAPGSADHR